MDNYEQQQNLRAAQSKAAKDVMAYVIMQGANCVGKISFQYNSANTACTCYLTVHGAGIAKGVAKGGGYDRKSAAADMAAQSLPPLNENYAAIIGYAENYAAIKSALNQDNGHTWEAHLRDAGYNAIQAI
jgi:hypothetical protein